MKTMLKVSMVVAASFALAGGAQAQDAKPAAAKPAAATATAAAAAAPMKGDPVAGKKVFKKCKACHKVGPKAKKGVGPALNNIIGAKAGVQAGYRYSAAMKKAGAGGLVWTVAKLKEYLKKPRKLVPRGKMAFAGLRKEADQDNIVAYLNTFTTKKN